MIYFQHINPTLDEMEIKLKGNKKCLPSIWLRVKVSRPTWHKIVHFGDVLPSQSLGLVLKKLNLTQQKQTSQEQISKKKRRKQT